MDGTSVTWSPCTAKRASTGLVVTAAAAAPVSAAPVAAAAGPAAAVTEAAPAAAPVEEKTEFDAVLTDVGPNKINVIKVVRELTGLGLKEAKAVVDEAPKAVKEGVSREEAEKIAQKMEEVGAKVTIR